MNSIATIRLSRALPLLVIGSFGGLLLFSIFFQHQQMLNAIETRALEDVRRLLSNAELQVETLSRHNDNDLIAEEIAGYGVDANINSIALFDDAGVVTQATRLDWIGRSYQEVLTNFVPEAFHLKVERSPIIRFSSDRQRILGYQPVMVAPEPSQIRPTKIGILFIDYDVSRTKSASWDVLVESMFPIIGASLLLMLVMGALISLWIARPLRHLTGVVARFAEGDYHATAQLTGKGELGTLGDAWNQMQKKLAETISQLEESKERFAVTLLSIGDAVIATDTDNRVTFMNYLAQQMTGWSLEQASGKPLDEVFKTINADTRQSTEAPVKCVLATGKRMSLTNRTILVARDNTEYQIADSAAPIRTHDGKIFGVVLVFRDVTEEVALQESLLHKKALLSYLIDAVPDLIFYKDPNSVYLGCNKAFEEFAGHTKLEHIGKTDFDLVDNKTAEIFRKNDLEVFEQGKSLYGEQWATYPDGRRVLLDIVKTPFYSPDGKLLGLVGISRDITERKRIGDKLAESEERIRSLGNNLPNGYIYQFSLNNDGSPYFQFISTGVEKIHGVTVEQALTNAMSVLGQIDSGQVASYKKAEEKSAREMIDFSMELLIHHPDGRNRWIQANSRPKIIKGQTVWDGVVIDITEKKLSEEQIWRQANFDPLTKLPNRRMFLERLKQEIKAAHRSGDSLALLFLDLDRFKEVNDSLGHAVGDKLLQIAAQRLSLCVRDTDTVSRLGGDEFTIILTDLDNGEMVERIAQSILASMSEPFLLHEEQSYVSASIGITLYPSDSSDMTQLIKNADQAMYAAKDLGRNGYCYFTASMQETAQYRLTMAVDLRAALALQQFQVYYQPIVELKTGRIIKAEALIRWNHPVRGFVSPAQFIPVAEDIGLIHEIGDWVFKKVAQQAKILRDKVGPGFQISINKSPVQFRPRCEADFNWVKHLDELGLDGQSVVVEITEGLLLDASSTTSEKLLAYRDAGVQVAIDDFGTGYSALSYLKKFDIDYIKIDQSFVRNLAPNSDDMVLCEAMIVMAHKLGMKVIAEGIETQEQCQLLVVSGCDYGQGYLFCKPVPADEFEQLLLKN